MIKYMIVLAALLLLIALLYNEKRESVKGILSTKPFLSTLFIITALIQPHPIPAYYHFILTGLLLCMAGDICLAFTSRKMFMAGLVSFLLGHVLYIVAFFTTASIGTWTWVALLLSLVLSWIVYARLKPHLGTMKVPVIAYILIITLMVIGAATVLGDAGLAISGRIMVFIGAVSFYVSDIFVARQRFVAKEFVNRAAGLPLYNLGQFLLAFSVGALNLVA